MKMKTLLCLLLALCLTLSAAACLAEEDEDAVFAKISEANTLEAILQNHQNVRAIMESDYGDAVYTITNYADGERLVTYDTEGYISIMDPEGEWGKTSDESGNHIPFITFFVDEGGYTDYLATFRECFLSTDLDEGELQPLETEDGVLKITLRQTREAVAEVYGEEIIEWWGDLNATDYVFCYDAETFEQLGTSVVEYYDDGTTEELMGTAIAYDGETYEIDEELYAQTHEQTRLLSITMDPGTEEETVWTAHTGKGVMAMIFLPEDYISTYRDAECTQEYYYWDADLNEDFVVYAKKGM